MPEEQVFNPPQKSILGSESSENISNEDFFNSMEYETNRDPKITKAINAIQCNPKNNLSNIAPPYAFILTQA